MAFFCVALAACGSSSREVQTVTGGSGSESGAGGEGAADGSAEGQAGVSEQNASDTSASGFKTFENRCKTEISSFVAVNDGTFELMTADSVLWKLEPAKDQATIIRKFENPPSDYRLMPISNFILFVKDAAMLQFSDSGKSVFKLQGMAHTPLFASADGQQIAILETSTLIHFWNVKEKFEGIAGSDRVQDYINRQLPSYNLTMPNDIVALDIGSERRTVVAINDTESNRKGVLYFYNPNVSNVDLKNLGRTNNDLKVLKMSPSTAFVAVIDEVNALKMAKSDVQGFLPWTQAYTDTRWIVWNGASLIFQNGNKILSVSPEDGKIGWEAETSESYTSCVHNGDILLCSANQMLDVVSAKDGTLRKRVAMSGEKFGIITPDGIKGSLESDCVK